MSRRIKLDKQPESVLVNRILVDFRTVSSISAGDKFKSSENLTHDKMKSLTSLYTRGTMAENGKHFGKGMSMIAESSYGIVSKTSSYSTGVLT